METVEVVIRIPKEYKDYIEGGAGIIPDKIIQYLFNALDNGTVLPKGHGRLIDADRLVKEECIDLYTDYGVESKVSAMSIEMSPTIIEANKEEIQ